METINLKDIDVYRYRVYSIETAAELLAVSPWTIRKWISERRIDSAKIGSRRVIPASEIKRIISEAFVERTS
jgi:excisionase family DNA binding protein